MKLCTICDKKIEGTWCKNCHRFVKTYDLSSGVYLNERHDPMNDKDCTYHTDSHTDSMKKAVGERTSSNTGRQRTYPSTTSTSASGTNGAAAKKKGKKLILIIIVVYILVNCLGFIVPAIVRVVNNASERYPEEGFENELYEEEIELSGEERAELLNKELRNTALLELTPVYHVEEEDYEILYFDPEDIEGIGYACDNRHFEMDLEVFESWLLANSEESFQYTDDISMYSNSYYMSSDYSQVNFTCYREYYGSNGSLIQADYDTTTKQLHGVSFATEGDTVDLELCYVLLTELEPEAELTREQFVKAVEEAKEVGEYATLYYMEKAFLSFSVNEDGYSLRFCPVF